MAITIGLEKQAVTPAATVFDTVIDLREWDDYAGVVMRGPDRPVAVGDRVDVALRVAGREIRCGFQVDVVAPPTDGVDGTVVLRSIAGPVDGELRGVVTRTPAGCDVSVALHGHARGAARVIERPLELIANRWATHQLRHLVSAAAARS